MLRFAAPEWFLLLPLLLLAAWVWPLLLRKGRRWLRFLALLLLVTALARPEIEQLKEGLDLWVVVDRSESAREAVTRNLPEWESILERHRRSRDRLFFIDYASDAVRRDASAGVTLPGRRDETRTASALRYTLGKLRSDRASRLLLLSDGYSTESLELLPEQMTRQGVPLDFRLTSYVTGNDFQLDDLRLPAQAAPGEPFVLELHVSGPSPSEVPFEVYRDGQPLTRGKVVLREGQSGGIARFTDRIATAGGHHYHARLLPENDALDGNKGNNQAERWIGIAGGPRLLLITSYADDPMAKALRSQQFEVEVVDDPASLQALHVGRLHGVRSVVLNNVAAHHLPGEFLKALDFFVREQGGGLLMTGGEQSFARGGYSGSVIDELLPVSMELKHDHRKLSLAMAIALDRSGSMTAAAGRMTKMDLANAGAARSVELLNPNDQIAVLAVDTAPHLVVPLSVVGAEAERLATKIRGIRSAGGGIFIEEALKAAIAQLDKSPTETKHLLLFSDASDSEKPGGFRRLIQDFTARGGTLSVIALGLENDRDARLLREIADLGKGRIFFSNDAEELPALFEQETVTVARSAFIKKETPLLARAGWSEIAAHPLEWPGAVDGYNLSYLRPEASAAAVTPGEEAAPLVAFWQRGSGRVAAVSFPLGGAYSEQVRAWAGYGDFLQTLCRWLQGETLPPGLGLRARVNGTELSAELHFDASWEPAFAQTPPRLVIASEEKGGTEELIWERMEPGRYRTSQLLAPGRVVRGALQVGEKVLPFGPLQAGQGAEWERPPERLAELAALSRATGGIERVNLATVWDAERAPRFQEITPWVLGALLAVFVLETLWTRLGALLPQLPKRKGHTKAARQPKQQQQPRVGLGRTLSTPPGDLSAPSAELPLKPAPDDSATRRRSRFSRARSGK